jgi:ParB-like chromosome segregation protein Spo0J
MPKQREFTSTMLQNMKNINSLNFSNSIKMLPLEKILPNPQNFFSISISDVELLAEDILNQGLKHNLVVKDNLNDTYTVISGHKRREAIKFLTETQGYSNLIPCLVEQYSTPDDENYALIMSNLTNRKLSDSEIFQSYSELRQILERKKNSEKTSGRLREMLSKELHISEGQAAKIENIRKNATPIVKKAISDNTLTISTAHEIAKLNPSEQEKIMQQPIENISHKEVKKLNQAIIPKERSPTVENIPEKGTEKNISEGKLTENTPVSQEISTRSFSLSEIKTTCEQLNIPTEFIQKLVSKLQNI